MDKEKKDLLCKEIAKKKELLNEVIKKDEKQVYKDDM